MITQNIESLDETLTSIFILINMRYLINKFAN